MKLTRKPWRLAAHAASILSVALCASQPAWAQDKVMIGEPS